MPASHLQSMRAFAYNNAWANHRLLTACAKLSQSEFEAKGTNFFPSIKATLNHILVIDYFYVDSLEGGTLGPAAWADEQPCGTVAELKAAQGAVDNRLIAFCNGLHETDLAQKIIRVHRGTRLLRAALAARRDLYETQGAR